MYKWKTKKVGDLGEIKTGKTPKTSITENYGGIIPFLTPSDDMSVKYVTDTIKHLTNRGLQEVKNVLLPKNSVCVSCIGSDLGKVVITTKPTVTNQQINSIIVNTYEYNVDFCYYSMLQLGKILNYHSKTSTAVPIVNKSSFSDYEILIPDLETQQKIAKVLSAIDDKIELNNSINNNLEQQAQAIFKSWFVDFEPFGGTMPNDWEITSLNNICCISAGGDKPKEVSKDKTDYYSVPIFSNGIDNEGLYGYTTTAKISRESVTISARGTIGYTCLRLEPYVPIVRLISVEPKDSRVSAKYLYHAIKKMNIVGYGTTQQQITVPYCKTLSMILPTQEYMNRFTDITNSIYKNISSNKYENSRLIQLRDTLLPKLMSGEIDVSKVEINEILEGSSDDKLSFSEGE